MAAVDLAARTARPQVPTSQRPQDLSAPQIAAFYRDFAVLREYVSRESERITLVGPFAHRQRYAPRHATRARFERWRVTRLTVLYARVPLLQRGAI